MKKNLIIAFATCLWIQGFSQEKLNKLSINPLQLFGYDITNYEYERGFDGGKLGVSFFYGRTGNSVRKINNYRLYVTEQDISIKRYSKNISKSSFWYGGQLSVASANIYEDNTPNRATNVGTLGLSGKCGYQLIHKSFYFDVYGGIGYAITNDLFGSAAYVGDIKEANILLTSGLKMGISF